MNPRHKSQTEGSPYLRYYAWNFTNLDKSMKQTVEFRAPPKVDNSDDCRSWVEFAVNFVHAAIQTDGPSTDDYGKGVRELHSFLTANTMKGCSDVRSWSRVVKPSSSTSNRHLRTTRASHRDFDVVEVIPRQTAHYRERYMYVY